MGHTLAVGAFVIMALTVVLVKAGNGQQGTSGGQQTATIVDSLSSGLSSTIKALEGGA